MKRILTVAIIVIFPAIAMARESDSCVNFQTLIKETYTFKPSKLKDSEQDTKSAAMDKVWSMARANPRELLPCLRAALDNPTADQWFRFDGSNLLVELDPSPDSKRTQIRSFENVDLADVNLEIWVETLARRGSEGFDVGEAGNRWLLYPKAQYFLPQHGAYEVKVFEGALFIFGSMDEANATPALLKIVSQVNHRGREHALRILMSQATDESLRALRQLDPSGFSTETRSNLRKLLNNPDLFTPRVKPKTSREEFVSAFQGIVDGKWDKFFRLVAQVPDGEKDVVAVLNTEDLPLVRKVRRLFIANSNQHAIEYYESFTKILLTMTSRKKSAAADN